jgi:hypothetical protein
MKNEVPQFILCAKLHLDVVDHSLEHIKAIQ